MTLRRRLLLLLLPSLALLLAAGALVDRWVALASTREAYDRALSGMASAAVAYLQVDAGTPRLSAQSGELLHKIDVDDAAASLTDQAADGIARALQQGQRYLAITGPDGALISGDAALAALTPRHPAESARGGPPDRAARSAVFQDAQLHGHAVRVVRVQMPAAGGALTVSLAETLERRDRTQHVMLLGKLLVDFAELDLTLLVVWLAVYFGLLPVSRLRAQAEAHASRELRRFDESGVPAELRPVVTSFNRALELLHDAAAAQRRFVADAAHQLRTPVAGLVGQIELLRADHRAQRLGPELERVQRGAQTLAHTANQLLSLARAEPFSAMQEKFQRVSLDALVKELVERHIGRADQAGIDLGADAQPAQVSGDAWLLEDLLTNLIDNALKYASAGGRVTVRSGVETGVPFVEVEDDGPGIPESERARVRERFYRRAGSPGIGVGLGLAIVDEIAGAHGGHLSIGTGAALRGARMRVQFTLSGGA
ncbi:MAG TPA: sensor histidine kinase [Steroidobacteraceae bacterium]|jgi:two-component system sensor histidine kinase TctE|nr:sensor histidine kinase [Steroidobacteraceae bacterium]